MPQLLVAPPVPLLIAQLAGPSDPLQELRSAIGRWLSLAAVQARDQAGVAPAAAGVREASVLAVIGEAFAPGARASQAGRPITRDFEVMPALGLDCYGGRRREANLAHPAPIGLALAHESGWEGPIQVRLLPPEEWGLHVQDVASALALIAAQTCPPNPGPHRDPEQAHPFRDRAQRPAVVQMLLADSNVLAEFFAESPPRRHLRVRSGTSANDPLIEAAWWSW